MMNHGELGFRILVVGCCGAGKTTLALSLGRELSLPVFHLDQLWWCPGWEENSIENFDWKLQEILQQKQWIIDGNYHRTLAERLKYADTVIFLDYPRRICLWRALKRIFRFHGRTRADMTPGCPERLDWEFLRYIWHFPRDMSPRIEVALAGYPGRVIRLRHPGEIF